MTKKHSLWGLVLVSMIGVSFGVSQAEEVSQGGFSFEVMRPENQRDSQVGYFDLTVVPGQQQTVVINLFNSSAAEIKVNVAVNSAKTNSNGVVEYGPNEIKKDESLKYDLAELVKVASDVTIPAKGQVPLELAIAVPRASFDGFISGGIQIQEVMSEEQLTGNQGMVVNKFAYLTGILLSESEAEIPADLAFREVYPDLKNSRNSIMVNFANVQPVYLEDMTVDVQVMKQGNEQVLFDTKKSAMRMAPNSLINFPVSMNGERMVPGEYQTKVVVTTKAGQKWEWLESFSITDEEADMFNQQDVGLIQEQGINWRVIIIIVSGGIGLILLSVILIVVVKRRKNLSISHQTKRKKKQRTENKSKKE